MSRRLLVIGAFIVFLGFALMFGSAAGQGGVSAGGVVFIGPFPIVFGSGPFGYDLALASVVIGGVMVVLMLIWGRKLFQ